MMNRFAAFLERLQARLKRLFAEYGRVAITFYLVLHLTVMAFAGFGLHSQYDVSSWKGFLALLFAVWVAAKASQIPRILITLAVTPFLAKLWHRIRPPVPPPPASP